MKHLKIVLFLVATLSLASTQLVTAQVEVVTEEKIEVEMVNEKEPIKTINRRDEASVKLAKAEAKETELKSLDGEATKEEDIETIDEEDEDEDDNRN